MGEKLEDGEEFTGKPGLLRGSPWLTNDLLDPDKDTIVTIEKVIRRKTVAFKDEKKTDYGSLRFVGTDKELGLNATHIAVLSALFPGTCAAWRGKRIALYVDRNVKSFGKVVSAVRIRAKLVPEAVKAAEAVA